MSKNKFISGVLIFMLYAGPAFCVDRPTKFSNMITIGNTRHNMTQRLASGDGPDGAFWGPNGQAMDGLRNDYLEVCVYCHTPHAANTTVNLPLWNRTIKATTYTTYNQLGTNSLTQDVAQPGINSLSCLSCHDGQTAVDSIINMPGSGRYLASQETSQNNAFLDSWDNTRGPDAEVHYGLNAIECLDCHAPNRGLGVATDFSAFALGTDLRNDHPVGVTFPATNGPGTDFNTPSGAQGNVRYFDFNANGTLDSGDVRIYDTGAGARVECASCHDPHGVPSAGSGTQFNPTFLRVANTGSALCMTCHTK